MRRKKRMANTIDDLRNLEPDWNGYGAEPIPDSVCDRAQKFVDLFQGASLLEIFPTARKSIQLEFENENYYLEIEVFEDRYTTMLAERQGDNYHRIEFEGGRVEVQ